jgi:hypothetical protein
MDKYMVIRLLLIIFAGATLLILVSRYNTKQQKQASEKFFEEMAKRSSDQINLIKAGGVTKDSQNSVQASEPLQNEDYRAVEFSGQQLPNDCFPRDRLNAEDLLPKEAAANSKWAQVNPAGQGDVKDQNFLQAGYHVGLNTTAGTMKNANLQIRSEPPNPRTVVSPFLNSSYEPDVMRRPLEIGENCA